jgi:hypothetical protein
MKSNSSEVIQRITKGLRINGLEGEQFIVSKTIVPVIEVDPMMKKSADIVRSLYAGNNGGGTIYTTPANQDFYLTGATLTMMTDNGATATDARLGIYVLGVIQYVLRIGNVPGLAKSGTISLSFNHPIKIDRNTAITIVNQAATANIITTATICGFVDESSLA